MSATLAIDDDVLAAARDLAECQRKTSGEISSDLARRGPGRANVARAAVLNGVPFLPLPQPDAAVTRELVNPFRDEMP